MRPKPSYVLPAIYGGLIIGVLSGVPYLNFVNCCCCAGILAGGVLSVFFYKNDLTPEMSPLESADALKVGALAGAIGGVVGVILQQLFQLLSGQNVKEELEAAFEQMPGHEGEAILQMFTSFFDSPLYILISLIISVFIGAMFGMLGGLIGYSIFKPRQQMMNMPPPYQQPPQTPL